ncbi:hypothetical protein IPA_00405 [Ignicoccus pacificus DSM 13166]|uniref:SAM-dependent methyltransferase TRM5/TYW2-type domain-containing protein n=1 Tax=Ignicoccus pacificus DSM 13166 TaxID=940294 RepID=A0A977PKH1_9CREN|nr:hypothetical protein IPA_00405 [Ignicoccus pacificus DSM 13166]
MRSRAVKVEKEKAQETLKEFYKKGIVKKELKIKKEGEYVIIPVTECPQSFECIEAEFEERKRSVSLKDCLKQRVGEGNWPRSFSIIGDIAVISANEEILRYGKEIAECIMENQRVKSVWAKVSTEGEERVARLIHLGGERRTVTTYKEHGLSFKVDIAKVYINPSFAEEHARVAGLVRDGERVLDAFSGLGFFSFHIAKNKRCECFAIDLNPWAIKFMIENIERNKRKLKGIIIPIMSPFELISSAFKRKYFDVTIMNLPHKAYQYLDRAIELTKRLIVLYVVGGEEEVKNKVEGYNVLNMLKVIDYAPYKYIWRVEISPEGSGRS